jgi:tetratricopeptide (TPR) repeat protein
MHTLQTIATTLASAKATDWALEVANSINEAPQRARALAELANELMQQLPEQSAMLLDQSIKLVETVIDDPDSASPLDTIAKVLLETNRLPEVLRIASLTKHIPSAVSLFCAAAESYHQKGNTSEALEILRRGREATEVNVDPKHKQKSLDLLAKCYAKIGEYDIALAVAEGGEISQSGAKRDG